MTTYFVSRHPGAVAWARRGNLPVDQFLSHIDNDTPLHTGDKVIGNLPVGLAAYVCASGAQYWQLQVLVPFELRGQELSVNQLTELGAHVSRYHVAPAAT